MVRVSSLISVVLLAASVALAGFVAGYSLAFSKTAKLHAQSSVLRAKAGELEAELLHLRNYAVLIDALAADGRAARELGKLPAMPCPANDTGITEPADSL